MLRNFLLVLCLVFCSLPVFSEEIHITITPLSKIATNDKNLKEGDIVYFKDINTGEEISGLIRRLTPNGFAGEQAAILISNFKYKNTDKVLRGQIYLKGGEHKKYQDMANAGFAPVNAIIRGGEVILKPEKTRLTIFFDDYINSEDTPIKIRAAQKISTCYDEIEVGDSIRFVVARDVNKNGKLYIKKGTPIDAIVDFVSDNGWNYDNAQIDFKQFKTKSVNGDKVIINSPLSIDGFEILKYKNNRVAQFFNYCGVVFRGKEVDIEPQKESIEFNIWLK